MPKNDPSVLSPKDSISISEFASLFGFTTAALISAIIVNRGSLKQPFYSIPELARRWCCSRATVYKIITEHEASFLDLSRTGKDKGKKLLSAGTLERIERQRVKKMDVAA